MLTSELLGLLVDLELYVPVRTHHYTQGFFIGSSIRLVSRTGFRGMLTTVANCGRVKV